MSDIGVGAKAPKKSCDDSNCPFHGSLSVRRKFLDGKVVSVKMTKTVTVERDYQQYVPEIHTVRKTSQQNHGPQSPVPRNS